MRYFFGKCYFLKKVIQIIVIFSLIALAEVPVAWGCSCVRTGNTTSAYKASEMVFLGEVVEVKEVGDVDSYSNDFEHTVKVEKAWKGVSGGTMFVNTQKVGSSCGIGRLKVGERLLIYSSVDIDRLRINGHTGIFDRLKQFFQKPRIHISVCDRIRSPESATLEMMYLDAAVEGRSENEIHQKLPGILRNHKDPLLRAQAAHMLGREAPLPLPKGSIPALLEGLNDPEIKVRKVIANAMRYGILQNIGEEFTSGVITAFLAEEKMWQEDNDRTLHLGVLRPLAQAVIKFGKRESKLKVVPHFIRELDGDEKNWAIWYLSHLGPDAKPAVPYLKKLLEKGYHPDYVLKVLKKIGTPEALEAVRAYKK